MDSLFLYFPVLFFVLYIISHHFFHKLHNLPPRPFPALPFIGHLYLLGKPFHRALFKVSNRYGSVVFLQFGSRPVLLVSSPSAAEECFTKNDIIFANRPDFLSGKYFGYNFTSLAWSSYGEHWRNLRRISSLEVLSSYRIQTLSSIRSDEINYLIRRLFRVSIESSEKTVEMKSSLFNFTFNVISRMIAGKRYYGEKVENSKEAKLFQDISKDTINTIPKSNILDFLPFMKWFGLHSVEEKMREVQEKRDDFMQKEIDEHRRLKTSGSFPSTEVVAGKKKTIMEVLLDLQKTDPEYYTDETIRNLMLVLLQAGSDTSAVTLEWAFSHLLDNPEILKKAQTEIDNHVGQDSLIDESDLAQLPYITCIINETLRMHPAAPLLMPHFSSEECKVAGYQVPCGTILIVNAWGIHHDPKVWEEPEKFNPDRFIGFEGVKEGCKFIPFGSGRRGCPGENLAIHVIGLALGSLLQCFEWDKPNREIIDMSEGTGFTLSPKVQPLLAKCSPRPNMVKLLSEI
ncbi:hypothetical protein K7X08_001975 [Anisodus acutangulus]|uniref:Cytochrome P450 n=1 Tax=Anisodus acutangulus TaxID=402998 RepID=A0A9Q1R3R0_9SOLA|nr:hypothetical protein K7X08_001975 [Anisodus acutangulus]